MNLAKRNYWNHTGRYQALADELNTLVPAAGEISGDEFEELEIYRRASNAYYDLFNNGACNIPGEVSLFFGLSAAILDFSNMTAVFRQTEPTMDRIILAAAKEQHIAIPRKGAAS